MTSLASGNRLQWRFAEAAGDFDGAPLGLSPTLTALLTRRGIADRDAARCFIGHHWEWQPHHWAWPALQTATDRILAAVSAGEPMAIYGDYDADGVTATAVLLRFLQTLGADVICYLPHRLHDGYGLSLSALDRLAAMGRRLVITVDNGVSAVAEIAHARAIGLEVIVTDHHTPPDVLPEPLALVNPKCYDPELGVLAGVGVAHLLCLSLQRAIGEGDADALLDIVAIGTVADQAPLTGVNRHLVHHGLQRLAGERRAGVSALLRSAGLGADEPVTAQTIGFVIGPRLNAAGRLEHPQVAVDLLLAPDAAEAARLAADLERLNQRRRCLTDEMTAHAQALIQETCDLDVDRCVTLWSPSWHHGVSGIVAARLCEAYARPVLLLCRDGEVWKGSGRSPDWVDLHALLKANAAWLMRFGGHRQAAGCTVREGDLEALRKGLNRSLRDTLDGIGGHPIPVDLEVPLSVVTGALVDELAVLEPTGQANPLPRLASAGLHLLDASLRGAHATTLIATVTDGQTSLRGVGLGAGHLRPPPEVVDLVYTPEWNHFRGTTTLQLRLHALGPAPGIGPATALPVRALPRPEWLDWRQVADPEGALADMLRRGVSVLGWATEPATRAQWAERLPSLPLLPGGPDGARSEVLVLLDVPAGMAALQEALGVSGAHRILVAWRDGVRDWPPLGAAALNEVYRRLKTLAGVPIAALAAQPWSFGGRWFPVVWDALRESGLVLLRGDRWQLLKPSGEPLPADELPSLRTYAERRRVLTLVATAGPEGLAAEQDHGRDVSAGSD